MLKKCCARVRAQTEKMFLKKGAAATPNVRCKKNAASGHGLPQPARCDVKKMPPPAHQAAKRNTNAAQKPEMDRISTQVNESASKCA